MRGIWPRPTHVRLLSTLFAHSISCALRFWREVPQRGLRVDPDRGANRENPRYIGRDTVDGGVVGVMQSVQIKIGPFANLLQHSLRSVGTLSDFSFSWRSET
jgi:hypothetical protein